jgi:hypothetical protein
MRSVRDVEYADEVTEALALVAMRRQDIAKVTVADGNRITGVAWDGSERADMVHALLEDAREKIDTQFTKLLRQHPLWPWLSEYKGLGGVQVARVIAGIAHPHRFPGQLCTEGHYTLPVYAVDAPCPRTIIGEVVGTTSEVGAHDGDLSESPCLGVMLPPRTTTGVRSLWHYLGLHAEDGKSPRFRRGSQASWDPELRAAVLMPDAGIASQIVRHRPEKYREVYDTTKARLVMERGLVDGVGHRPESGGRDGPVRLGWADATARKVAVKAFVGDLLVEWKSITPSDQAVGSVVPVAA